ncbi:MULTISPECIES: hypothetical protein [unclassified Pseudomonas]|uniref:hypothetical protein n=1 Tax=unclassified Pseudomonas TaxID=196821 RepID=UPI00083975F0|nr:MULTISPECIES: hypothetical protein [unclassified Pseudomonas]QIH09017.1 hypothetical protein ATY02_20930 [Pseudomonas sp. BIOMIG1BAC]
MFVLKIIGMLFIGLFAKIAGWELSGRDARLSYRLGLVVVLLVGGFLILLLSFSGFLTFGGDSQAQAFGRSGSLATVMSLYAKHRLDLIGANFDFINQVKDRHPAFERMYANLEMTLGKSGRLCLFFAVVSALVWGYGDIFLLWIYKY